jgi:alpha-tubulin suppressor-like RCC1 family protein
VALGALIAALLVAAPAGASVVGWGLNHKGELGAGFISKPHLPIEGPPALAGATQVVSTYFSSYALMPDGTVWSWGDGVFGELGNGERVKAQLTPVRVLGLTGVKQIAAGGAHVVALLSDGRVATWGGNYFGTLGIGTHGHGTPGFATASDVPVFPEITGAVAVAAGGGDDAAVLSNGTVLAWGENFGGQLGDGTRVEKDVPTPVLGASTERSVAIGGVSSHAGHMLLLLANGTVLATGANSNGELGDGTTQGRDVPAPVPGLSGVTAVSASIDHSMALLASGSVFAWGGDTVGQIGVQATARCQQRSGCVTKPAFTGASGTAIAAGRGYSLVVWHGGVLAFGLNEHLQLGQAGPSHQRPTPIPGVSGVTSVSASEFHSLALGTVH